MLTPRVASLAFFALAACTPAPAASDISVTDAWARATAPGQSNAAIYARIRNAGTADTLVEVRSDAGMAMLHANEARDGVARMRMLDALPIAAGQTIDLAPGATHIMLGGVRSPLVAGSDLAMTMRFASGRSHAVRVAIVAPGAR